MLFRAETNTPVCHSAAECLQYNRNQVILTLTNIKWILVSVIV